MIYRMRIYQADPERIASSHAVFHDHVMPVHLKHGARFVGRWTTGDGRVVVLWEYDSREQGERIQEAVRDDPESRSTAALRRDQGLVGCMVEEVWMAPTGGSEGST